MATPTKSSTPTRSLNSTPTRSPSWRRLGHSHSPVIDKVISKKKDLSEAQASLSWMGANVAGAILAYVERDFGLLFGDHLSLLPFREGLFSSLVLIFVINAFVDLLRFARPLLSRGGVIELTEAEQKLLGVKPNDASFKLAKTPPPATPPKTSFIGISSRPPSPLHPTPNQSVFNVSAGSLPGSADTSLSQRRTPKKIVSMNETISDHGSLQEYLKEHEANERKKRVSLPDSSPVTSSPTSFWAANRGGGGVSMADSAALLRKYQYQLASKSPQTTKNQGSSDDPDNPNAINAEDVWASYKVSDEDLMQWTMNLRNWISETILVPLVKEIEAKNDKLRRTGHGDSLIGEVGLATLKRVATIDASLDLDLMIQYLEIHENQEYLVRRIKTLSKGGCMSGFNSVGGDSFKDKPWSETLPTDASIVLHCFASYLDSQLPLTSFYPDLKAFTRQHVIKTPDKVNPTKKENLLIFQSTLVPPQFKVVIGENVYEVAKGHNNLFHALVLFLLHIKSLEHGVLGRINLGLTGLNILNVLN